MMVLQDFHQSQFKRENDNMLLSLQSLQHGYNHLEKNFFFFWGNMVIFYTGH